MSTERIGMGLIAACVLVIISMVVLVGRRNAHDRTLCRAKGGVPVLMRDGILCLPAGAAIPLND